MGTHQKYVLIWLPGGKSSIDCMHDSSGCKYLPTNPLIGETFSVFPPEVCVSGYRLCGMRAAAARKAISLFTPHTGLFISQQGHRNVFEAQRAQPKCVGCVNAPLTRIKCLQWGSFYLYIYILFDKAAESALHCTLASVQISKSPSHFNIKWSRFCSVREAYGSLWKITEISATSFC